MKEIKFRAWDKTFKHWCKFCSYAITLEGELIRNDSKAGDEDELIYRTKDQLKSMGLTSVHLENIILMQYTGLKDKNRKEIYEGDILERLNGTTDVVIFDTGSFCIQHKNGTYDFIAQDNRFRIIGNIYENLELLKESD